MSKPRRWVIVHAASSPEIKYNGTWFTDHGSFDSVGTNGPPYLSTLRGTSTNASFTFNFAGRSCLNLLACSYFVNYGNRTSVLCYGLESCPERHICQVVMLRGWHEHYHRTSQYGRREQPLPVLKVRDGRRTPFGHCEGDRGCKSDVLVRPNPIFTNPWPSSHERNYCCVE